VAHLLPVSHPAVTVDVKSLLSAVPPRSCCGCHGGGDDDCDDDADDGASDACDHCWSSSCCCPRPGPWKRASRPWKSQTVPLGASSYVSASESRTGAGAPFPSFPEYFRRW